MSHFNLFDCSQVELPAGAPPVGGLLGVVEQLICMSHYCRLEFLSLQHFTGQCRFHLRGDVSKEAGMEETQMNLSLDINIPPWFELSL